MRKLFFDHGPHERNIRGSADQQDIDIRIFCGSCPDEVLDRVIYTLPASDLAKQLGDLKYANSVLLGAVAVDIMSKRKKR